jgi:tetratricopeptide (TPR) repeat protein
MERLNVESVLDKSRDKQGGRPAMKRKASRNRKFAGREEEPARSKRPAIETTTFALLVIEDEELAQARREYALLLPEERRRAAEFQYDHSIGDDIFRTMMAAAGERIDREDPWKGTCFSLAIDPDYGPAMLSIGSLEYQYGRIEEAMGLFLRLTDLLEEDIDDLLVIIDKAGDFLLHRKDYDNALRLYSAAATKYPAVALYRDALGYCYGKLGDHAKAAAEIRRAVEIEPDNYRYYSDLGWSLTEAGAIEEAMHVLEKAVAIAPPDYERARANLGELKRRIKTGGVTSGGRGHEGRESDTGSL